jgi:hypothetical protein
MARRHSPKFARFGSNGMAFSERAPVVPTQEGIAMLNAYEVGPVVVTFVTLVAKKWLEAVKGSRDIGRYATLNSISIADPAPTGVQRTGRPDRLRRFVARTCPCVRGNPAAYCGQRARAARQGTVITSGADGVPGPAQALLGTAFLGARLLSSPRAATSRTMSYFSTFRSTNLPASAGSYSVSCRLIPSTATCDADR